MSETRWFRAKSNSILHHALTADERAACSMRIRPRVAPLSSSLGNREWGITAQPASELPEYAVRCAPCLVKVEGAEKANQDRFVDWDESTAVLEIIDNADSISFSTRVESGWGELEVQVRIAPEDLDRLDRRIAEIRAARNI